MIDSFRTITLHNQPFTKSLGLRYEWMIILAMLVAFLGLNLATADRFPIPWQDEVKFVDPAANLYFGRGFTSTAYDWELRDQFHAHDPLYSALLAGWMEIVGFNVTGVRSLNYFLIILTALMIWYSTKRLNLISTARHRILLVLLMLLSYSVSFVYRTGRVEPLLIFLVAFCFLVFTITSGYRRYILLASTSTLFAAAGLQLVAFVGIFSFLLLLYLRKEILLDCLSIWAGVAIGLSALLFLYGKMGVLDNALEVVLPHATTGVAGSLVSDVGFSHKNRLPKDPSLILLLTLLVVLFVYTAMNNALRWKSTLSFALAAAFTLPVCMLTLAKFPTYYAWMVSLPIAVCICSFLSNQRVQSDLRTAAACFLALAVLAGLPMQLLVSSYDWSDRATSEVSAVINRNLHKDDWVLTDYESYYPVKALADTVFLPEYAGLLNLEERERVNVLIGTDQVRARWKEMLGGDWVNIANDFAPHNATLLHTLAGQRFDVGLLGKQYRFGISRRL